VDVAHEAVEAAPNSRPLAKDVHPLQRHPMPLTNDGRSFAAPQVIQDRKRAIGRYIGTGIRSIGGHVHIVRVPGNWRRQQQHAGWRR